MLPLRTRIFIIISLVVLVILGISILVWVLNKPSENAPAPVEQPGQQNLPAGTVLYNGTPVVVAPVRNGLTPPNAPTTLEIEQNSVRQLARIFTIRYNSYSTDANYQNIRDVEELVTESLWAQISKPLVSGNAGSRGFLGVTTNVIGTELATWDNGVATVAVKATSVQDKNGVQTTTAKNGTVSLVKTGGKWLVDKFIWEK